MSCAKALATDSKSAFGGIVARSPAMQKIFALIENLQRDDLSAIDAATEQLKKATADLERGIAVA